MIKLWSKLEKEQQMFLREVQSLANSKKMHFQEKEMAAVQKDDDICSYNSLTLVSSSVPKFILI